MSFQPETACKRTARKILAAPGEMRCSLSFVWPRVRWEGSAALVCTPRPPLGSCPVLRAFLAGIFPGAFVLGVDFTRDRRMISKHVTGLVNYEEGSFEFDQVYIENFVFSLFPAEKKAFRDRESKQKLFLVERPSLVHFLCPNCREGVLFASFSACAICREVVASPALAFSLSLPTQVFLQLW